MLKTSGPSTLCLKSAISQTFNRLERSLAQNIVSNILWKLAELTDEAVSGFWKLKSAMEIIAAAAPSKTISQFAAINANDACLECILDDVTAITRTIKDSISYANDDHLSAATFMEAIENSIANDDHLMSILDCAATIMEAMANSIANDDHLMSIQDSAATFMEAIANSIANDDHLMSILDSAVTFMEAIEQH